MALALRPSTYESFIRPLLFQLPPERAQRIADQTLRLWPLWRSLSGLTRFRSPRIETTLAGIDIANPIGLAAGYDKNCSLLPGLSSLGFGYVTCGTVTLEPRSGNPGTRLIRDAGRGALINSLGFPGKGLYAAAEHIAEDRGRITETPVVASVSGTCVEEIVECHRTLEPLTDAIEINISSPNTAGLRLFHDDAVLASLLAAVNESRSKPLFVKMPPLPVDGSDAGAVLRLAEICADRGVDALTVANTQPVQDPRLSVGSGGLSGRPIFGAMLRMVAAMRERVGESVAINACGGIFSARDAWSALVAGADTVQLLTGFVYRGPGIARHISRGLATILEAQGLDSVRRLRTLANQESDG